MANEERDLEQLTTVSSQLLGRIADNAPEAVEHALNHLPPERRQDAEHAIAHGRWNNRRG